MSKKLLMNNSSVEYPIHLVNGQTFNGIINQLKNRTSTTITSIVFTKNKIPTEKIVEGILVSESVSKYRAYGYVDGNTIYISPEENGGVLYANRNCHKMFFEQKTLTSILFGNFDTLNVIDMSAMFNQCNNLLSLDLRNWNTSKVTNMNSMFSRLNNSSTVVGVEDFDTSSVTDMTAMFDHNYKLEKLDLSKWVTSNVNNMSYMFSSCVILSYLNLSGCDFSKITNFLGAIYNCPKLSGEMTINNPNITSYSTMFSLTSTSPNSRFVVKYIDKETKAMAEKLVATKSANSNVVLWEGDN